MHDPLLHEFRGRDGTRLVYRELGTGRPLILIHGYLSNSNVNWLRYGHAKTIADCGHRVFMPDLRAHGGSGAPHDPAAYPPDVLTDDGFMLLERLGIEDYDLGGYSLGARTVIRMLARGATPRRAIVAGMGLDGILQTGQRSAHFRRILDASATFTRGSPEWLAQAFLKTVGGDPAALLHVLDTFVDTPRDALMHMHTPTLVLSGAEDHDNGSAQALAEAMPNARFATIPGNHMSAVAKPELGQAIADFLDAPL